MWRVRDGGCCLQKDEYLSGGGEREGDGTMQGQGG